jgi:hypothetical protein
MHTLVNTLPVKNSTEIFETAQTLQARPRLGSELVAEYRFLEKRCGPLTAREWAVRLPKEDWLALMEAMRTGLKPK